MDHRDVPHPGRCIALHAVAIPPVRRLNCRRSSKQLSTQLQTNRERYGIAGQAVLVAHNGQVLYQRASGERDPATHAPATVETIFAAQSMAKLLTSTLVMQLVDQGKVDLDAPASRYVPDLPAAWQAIHVRDSSTTARVSASTTIVSTTVGSARATPV